MNVYLFDISVAAALFPLVAGVFTLPYLVYRYRRFGAIPWLRALGVYSFILYCMCMYFLVILPLPADRTAIVEYARTPQLVPFHFLEAFTAVNPFDASDSSTWLPTIKVMFISLYDDFFNLIMTVPLGMYLRYFFRRPWWQVFVLGFAATLFFELSQITGLWGIYDHPYRLFDVDDLIINTAGALLGAALVTPLMRVLPDMRLVEVEGMEAGVRASATRRMVSFAIDGIVTALVTAPALFVLEGGAGGLRALYVAGWQGVMTLLEDAVVVGALASVAVFAVVPFITRGKTPGQALLRLVIVRPDASPVKRYQPAARYGLLFLMFAVPLALLLGIVVLNYDPSFIVQFSADPEMRRIASFVGNNTRLLLAAWLAIALLWAVSLLVRAAVAHRRGTSLVMLNGLMSRTRVMTVEGARIARERNVVLSVEEVAAEEARLAASGIALFELMERAGHAVAEQVRRWVPDAAPVVVFTGSGNNGGDGWVVARDLAAEGYAVTLVAPDLAERLHAEPALSMAQVVFAEARDRGLPLRVVVRPSAEQVAELLDGAAAVVDAMLGTGFSGDEVREPYATWIEMANRRRFEGVRGKGRGNHRKRERVHAARPDNRTSLPNKVRRAPFAIAIDVPSGLSAQTGRVALPCFVADITVTMIAYKPGLVRDDTTPWTGIVKLEKLA